MTAAPGRPGVLPSVSGGQRHIDRIVASGDRMVAIGRLTPRQVEFVDVFTLFEEGMLRSCRRYDARRRLSAH
ncbi:hypothetical protein [Streptomyces chryseus]|uniref:hypothetical protein n=1 Tax=Streptomyces chryseus TaxID=68186 RepID=UPI00110F83AF|nr:hypothetical protein [Streptomyces chryseus]GGX22990.1 hypothetical protein GCM10010353_42500 [Streptomyces chryseus]